MEDKKMIDRQGEMWNIIYQLNQSRISLYEADMMLEKLYTQEKTELAESPIANVMRSLQEKKKVWEEKVKKCEPQIKLAKSMGNYEYARILKAELDLFNNFNLDLEEIINQNFA
jgi:hypothetical protein